LPEIEGPLESASMTAVMTTTEAATLLNVTPVRVRQLIVEKQLPAQKKGRDYILLSSDVELFNNSGRRKTGRPRKPIKAFRTR